jgi:cytochrome c5
MSASLAAVVAAGLLAAALPAAWAQASPFAEPADRHLQHGRGIWLGTCRECHANSLSDAPHYKNGSAWQPRLARGSTALYASALRGRVGEGGAEMPPRGGNDRLTDDEVKAAVDYMVWLVQSTRKETR